MTPLATKSRRRSASVKEKRQVVRQSATKTVMTQLATKSRNRKSASGKEASRAWSICRWRPKDKAWGNCRYNKFLQKYGSASVKGKSTAERGSAAGIGKSKTNM